MKKGLFLVLLFFIFIFSVNAANVKNTATTGIDTVFIGDSYCVAYNSLNDATYSISRGWAAKVKERLGLEKAYYSCYYGAGFLKKYDNNDFFTLLRDAKNNSSIDRSGIKLLVVAGGLNDYNMIENSASGQAQLVSSINSFITEARSYFPNAQIVLAAIDWVSGTSSEATLAKNMMQNRIAPAFSQSAAQSNVLVIANGLDVMKNHEGTYFSNDYIHPNNAGQEAIADLISDYIRENSVSLVYNHVEPSIKEVYITGKGGRFKNLDGVTTPFEGWSTSSSGEVKYAGNALITDSIILNNGIIQLYPKFGTVPVYSITTNQDTNVTINFTNGEYHENDVVNFTVVLKEGYDIESVKVYNASNQEVTCTFANGSGSFRMPASNVRIVVNYVEQTPDPNGQNQNNQNDPNQNNQNDPNQNNQNNQNNSNEPKENPKTGVRNYIIFFVILIMVGITTYLVSISYKKKINNL